MDHRDLLRRVRRRPGMYLGTHVTTYDAWVAFLGGLDLGGEGVLLDGFHEYLALRFDEDSPVGWPGRLVQHVTGAAAPRPLSDSDDRAVTDALFDLLDEFLVEFPPGRGRQRLHHEYLLWKQKLRHFNLDLERFSSAPPDAMMTVDEAAASLGITRPALFDLVASGTIRVCRSGATLLVRASRVDELRASRAVEDG